MDFDLDSLENIRTPIDSISDHRLVDNVETYSNYGERDKTLLNNLRCVLFIVNLTQYFNLGIFENHIINQLKREVNGTSIQIYDQIVDIPNFYKPDASVKHNSSISYLFNFLKLGEVIPDSMHSIYDGIIENHSKGIIRNLVPGRINYSAFDIHKNTYKGVIMDSYKEEIKKYLIQASKTIKINKLKLNCSIVTICDERDIMFAYIIDFDNVRDSFNYAIHFPQFSISKYPTNAIAIKKLIYDLYSHDRHVERYNITTIYLS